MQLQLGGGGEKLSLDSAIDGFDQIVAETTENAGINGLNLETTTLENLKAMGLAPAELAPAELAPAEKDYGDAHLR